MFSMFASRCICSKSYRQLQFFHCKRFYFAVNTLKTKILQSDQTCAPRRTFSILNVFSFIRKIRNPRATDLFKRDGLNPSEYKLIYRYDMFMNTGWIVVHCTTFFGLCAFLKYLKLTYGSKEDWTEDDHLMLEQEMDPLMKFILFIYVTHSIVYSTILKRQVLRIYYSPKSNAFKLVTLSLKNPLKTVKRDFKPGECKITEDAGQIRAYFGNAYVNNKKCIIYSCYFKHPMYYNGMFGFIDKTELRNFEDYSNPDPIFDRKKSGFDD